MREQAAPHTGAPQTAEWGLALGPAAGEPELISGPGGGRAGRLAGVSAKPRGFPPFHEAGEFVLIRKTFFLEKMKLPT